MINHKATISALAQEFQSIVGGTISAIYTQDSGVLFVEVYANNNYQYIEFSTNSPYDRLLLRSKHNRAKANTFDLYGQLLESTIISINQVNEDRVMVLCTELHNLYFKIFGHNQSDLIITNKKNKIIHSLNNSETIGTSFNIHTNVTKELSDFDDDIFFEKAMQKCKYYFGKYYTERYLKENEKYQKKLLKNINKTKADEELEQYYYKIAKSKVSFVYKLDNAKYLFSLIKLDGYELYKKCDSISDGIRTKFVKEVSQQKLEKLRSASTNKLLKLIEKDEKAVQRIDRLGDGIEESNRYRNYAELLISQPNPKLKLGNSISLQDWEGKEITIGLDEKLNLIDNSQKYFKKASSILKEREIVRKKLPAIIVRVSQCKNLLAQVNNATNAKDIVEIIKNNPKILGGIMEKRPQDQKEDKFKKFELSENYILYVGKNAKNNDELTVRFAKPNDIWLHARGVSGSHCVIRADGREPSKGIIKEAAEIAAYYSKAKNAKLVPVIFTHKKHVNKPRGANTGAVTVRKEEVIMVEPKKPKSTD